MERVAHSRSCSPSQMMNVSPPTWESGPGRAHPNLLLLCGPTVCPILCMGGGTWLGFRSLPVEEDGHTAGLLGKYALTSVPWRIESMPSRV